MPTRTPITIPAIAPPLRPPPPDEWLTIGRVLPLAVAGGVKGWVVVTETVATPLVRRKGGEPLVVIVGVATVFV